MSWKLESVLCLTVVICVGCILAAPRSIKNEKELARAFQDFLAEDKEAVADLEKTYFGDGPHLRFRRASDISVDGIEMGQNEETEPAGFFDRAAKFVMELLQKFLKWINTDGN